MLGTSYVKHNNLVNTVIQSLDRPWEYEKPSDLVVKIMAACPDLIKFQFSILEPYLEPRISVKWIAVMQFVRKVIYITIVTTFFFYIFSLFFPANFI